MPQPIYPPAGPQSIGQVLDTGFRIFQVSLVRCLLYGAVGMIAGQLPNIYSIMAGKPLGRVDWRNPVWVGLYGAGAFLSVLTYAALVVRQHHIVTGQRRGIRMEILGALRRLPSLLGVALIGSGLAALGFVLGSIASGAFAFGAAVRVAALVLCAVMVLPAVYCVVPLSLTTPALMIDGQRALPCVRYALALITGCWWRTVVVYLMAFVIIVAFYVVATIAGGILAFSVAGSADVVAMSASAAVVYVALGALGVPFVSATVLATYGELKVRRQAIDLETRLAGVAHP